MFLGGSHNRTPEQLLLWKYRPATCADTPCEATHYVQVVASNKPPSQTEGTLQDLEEKTKGFKTQETTSRSKIMESLLAIFYLPLICRSYSR